MVLVWDFAEKVRSSQENTADLSEVHQSNVLIINIYYLKKAKKMCGTHVFLLFLKTEACFSVASLASSVILLPL